MTNENSIAASTLTRSQDTIWLEYHRSNSKVKSHPKFYDTVSLANKIIAIQAQRNWLMSLVFGSCSHKSATNSNFQVERQLALSFLGCSFFNCFIVAVVLLFLSMHSPPINTYANQNKNSFIYLVITIRLFDNHHLLIFLSVLTWFLDVIYFSPIVIHT